MEVSPPPVAFICCVNPTEKVNSSPVKLVQDEHYENLEQQVIALGRFVMNAEKTKKTDKLNDETNFTLTRWSIYDEHFINMADENATDYNPRFWRLYGPSIKILTLVQCKIPYCFTLLSLVFWRAVPNLERLSLLDCEMEINTKVFFTESKSRIEQLESQELELKAKIHRYNELLRKPANAYRHEDLLDLVRKSSGVLSLLRVERQSLVLGKNKLKITEEQQMKDTLQNHCKDLTSSPTQLRFLEIENLKSCRNTVTIDWSDSTNIFPSLENILVRQQDVSDLEIPLVSSLQLSLSEINVMNLSNQVDMIKCETLLELSTKRLSFDCGHDTPYDTVVQVLEHQAATIEKLCLFRAPFAQTYDEFPCTKELLNLTVCHLWGNVARNLNFLKLMPCLKEFKWNTDCYDEETRGSRLNNKTSKKDYWVYAQNIVESTRNLPTMDYMETFQLEMGALSLSSLGKLGRMFPNLKAFKAALDGNDKLVKIGKQWQQLERLEIAQCSSVTAKGIWNAMSVHRVFPSLNNFTWKRCACSELNLGEEEMRAVTQLKNKFGENAVYPQVESSPSCLRVLYRKTLCPSAGFGLESIDTLNSAVCASPQYYK